MSTIVRMRANQVSTSEWWKEIDGKKPNLTTASLSVVDTTDESDPNFPYSNLSPGSYLSLSTINEDAGKQFEQGAEYEITIKRVK
jgi:hypothetical protein